MLLRILDPANGLCNGSRLICRDFTRHLIHAEIATDPSQHLPSGSATCFWPKFTLIKHVSSQPNATCDTT
ncbi:hypothetical protein ACS0TY_008940 [Phlomoides rotata]